MVEENTSQKFTLKNIVETRNYFLEEISKMNWWVKGTERIVKL